LKALQYSLRSAMIAGTAQDKAQYFVRGTTLESSRTENPSDSVAVAKGWSPQRKPLLDGRFAHQINDAALQAMHR
jgi:hypothetical protein